MITDNEEVLLIQLDLYTKLELKNDPGIVYYTVSKL